MTEGSEVSIVGQLANRYAGHPEVRALLQLVPGWGAADTLLQRRADEIRSDRMMTFFDALASGELELTDELIQTEDFLHCYFSTLRAALNTRQRKKIQLLASLLSSSLKPETNTGTDEFEELLAVLEAISFREFAVLCDLHRRELRYPRKEGQNDLQVALQYWTDFKNDSVQKISIPEEAFNAFMAKLERTGLYLRITAGFWDYEGDVGRTTPLFARLLEFVTKDEVQP